MKIQIMSDLHLEFYDQDCLYNPEVAAKTLILAGDIHIGFKAKYWFINLCSKYENIIYIPGNHEYYRQNFSKINKQFLQYIYEINEEAKARKYSGRIYGSNKGSIKIQDINFIFTTLWTDFNNANPLDMINAEGAMNDYRLIKNITNGNYHRFRAKNALNEFYLSKRFMVKELEKEGKKVVITHHLPTHNSIDLKYKSSYLNSAFASELPELINKANIWVHGHTHSSCDYLMGNTRIICNPFGYKNHDENKDFNPKLVIEV